MRLADSWGGSFSCGLRWALKGYVLCENAWVGQTCALSSEELRRIFLLVSNLARRHSGFNSSWVHLRELHQNGGDIDTLTLWSD